MRPCCPSSTREAQTHHGWSGDIKQSLNHMSNDAVVRWWSCDAAGIRWLPFSRHQLITVAHTHIHTSEPCIFQLQKFTAIKPCSIQLHQKYVLGCHLSVNKISSYSSNQDGVRACVRVCVVQNWLGESELERLVRGWRREVDSRDDGKHFRLLFLVWS